MNDKAVYRTAPATPGLLTICVPSSVQPASLEAGTHNEQIILVPIEKKLKHLLLYYVNLYSFASNLTNWQISIQLTELD